MLAEYIITRETYYQVCAITIYEILTTLYNI